MGRFVCVGMVGVAIAAAAAVPAAVPAAFFCVVVIVDLFVQEIMALNWYVSLSVCMCECAFVCI